MHVPTVPVRVSSLVVLDAEIKTSGVSSAICLPTFPSHRSKLSGEQSAHRGACASTGRSNASGAIVDESRAGVHDDLMRVPGKPLGFLAASTIEYHGGAAEQVRSST